jgi:PIN domain nuclease of toxin-antitoxin system
MSTFIVDTHALVWYLDEDKKLSKNAEEVLDSSEITLVIPTMVLAEVKYLFGKKRIPISFEDVIQAIENDQRCIIYPFDLSCVESLDERFNLHDGIIVATGVIFRDSIDPSAKIITRDRTIRESGIIDILW